MERMESSKDQLFKHVEFLTTIRPFRNYRNLESLAKVCDYLKKEFQQYGLEARDQAFTVDGREYQNIIASFQPEKRKRLILGAHYDVCGDQPGADDNASAVAGLLESARMIAKAQPNIDYGIDFVAYCLEEPPFFATQNMGSYKHAESVKDQKEDLIGVINYEMIGYFNDEEQPYPDPRLKARYPEKANFIAVVGQQKYHDFNQKVFDSMKAGARIDIQIIDDPMVEGLAGLSDQRSYWEFDIPALMINDTSFIRNQNYHMMSDDIDTLSFDHMREVVTSTYQAIVGF